MNLKIIWTYRSKNLKSSLNSNYRCHKNMNIGWQVMSLIPKLLPFFFIGPKPLLECINTCWDFSCGAHSNHELQLKIFLLTPRLAMGLEPYFPLITWFRPTFFLPHEMDGQNGPIPSIFEIFSNKTLFRKLLGIYHFFWYSSLVSSSTIFFNPPWHDDIKSWN